MTAAALAAVTDAARVVSEQARRGLPAVTPEAWEALNAALCVLADGSPWKEEGPRWQERWKVARYASRLECRVGFDLLDPVTAAPEKTGAALLGLRGALDALDEA
jgi:hypothetical protein